MRSDCRTAISIPRSCARSEKFCTALRPTTGNTRRVAPSSTMFAISSAIRTEILEAPSVSSSTTFLLRGVSALAPAALAWPVKSAAAITAPRQPPASFSDRWRSFITTPSLFASRSSRCSEQTRALIPIIGFCRVAFDAAHARLGELERIERLRHAQRRAGVAGIRRALKEQSRGRDIARGEQFVPALREERPVGVRQLRFRDPSVGFCRRERRGYGRRRCLLGRLCRRERRRVLLLLWRLGRDRGAC